jgi:PEP-CTERM motif
MQSKWISALLVTGCVALLSGIGFAAACPGATYDHYLGLSCTITNPNNPSDVKTFNNFQYTSDSNPFGFGLPATSVFVTPITTPLNPGFQFSGAWMAGGGIQSMDSLIQFTVNVSPGGALITDMSLSMGGYGFSGLGSVHINETVCLGATFPACSGGIERTLEVFTSSSGTQRFDEISFAGVSEIDVQKDILLSAGTESGGSAELSLVTNQFSESGAVPEPGSILLFGSGALALAGVLRRKLNH